MSGNQEPRISLPTTWRCSDLNPAIPIKKRKYFVQPMDSTLLKNNPKPNEQGDTSVLRNALDSSGKQNIGGSWKNLGEPIPSFPSVSVGNADIAETIGDKVRESIRVKVEEPNFPFHFSPLAGFEIPSSSNISDNTLHCSLGKRIVSAEHTSDQIGMKLEHTVLKTHDIVRETCGKENLRGECQTEASGGVGIVSIQLGLETKNHSPYLESDEPTSLNLLLSKGVCSSHHTDSISICTKSGNHSGVNRSNWDLNTTMDAWGDALDRKTRVKTTGPFLNSNRNLDDIETSSCRDATVISKSVSGKHKESVGFHSRAVTVMQFNHQNSPTCSLSLGLNSYPSIEKSPSISTTTSEARAACTSFSKPIMVAANVTPVNPRTVKSEVIEESVRPETESAEVCSNGLSINRVKQEVAGRFSQENSASSGILKTVDPSVKTEPNNSTQSEVFNRRDRTLDQSHTPIMQSNEMIDLPTSSTRNPNDTHISYSNSINNAPLSLNGMAINRGVQSYLDYRLKESGQSSNAANSKLRKELKHGEVNMTYSCSGHGDHKLVTSGVNVTSFTEEKILDDCKTCISKELPRNSRGTDELSIGDEEKIILSGKELEKDLYSRGFESDCGHDLSRGIENQVGKRILNDDRKVKGPAVVFVEGNGVELAKCGGSETEQTDTAVPFQLDFQNTNRSEKESQPALLGNTSNKYIKECSTSSSTNKFKKHTVDDSYLKLVKMASTEVQVKRLAPELQSGIFGGSCESEDQIVQDGEQSTHQTIHASEGMSSLSTLSGENVENPEIVDNSTPVSYKAEISPTENDSPAGFSSEGSHSRIINLAQASNKSPIKTIDGSENFQPLRMERERLPDFSSEPRKYLLRGSDESYKFSHGRYHGKMRSPRLNFMPDRTRLSDKIESNLHDRDTKSFEFNNRGRPDGAFMSNFHRGRRTANDVVTPFSNSFPRRTPSFSYTHRGPANKEDASTFHGFRDGEKFTRGLQCNNTEPMFISPPRPYQGRNSFARGRSKFSNHPKQDFLGFSSHSPIRSRERSAGPSSSFRNRAQEEFIRHTDFSHRRSPSGYRMERISSPDHSGYPREMVVRRHNSPPPYSHRPSNAGKGRGYARGRGYVRGQGYGRYGIPFRKSSDRVVHRNHGNLNNLNSRERVDHNDDFFEGLIHSERFGVDVNVERRQFSYRHVDPSSFRPSFNNDGCAPTNVENDPAAVRFGQDPDNEIQEQGRLMESDGKHKNSTENASGTTKNMEGEETSKHKTIWQQDELGGKF